MIYGRKYSFKTINLEIIADFRILSNAENKMQDF